MTEAEWSCGTNPTAMLDFLRGRASRRKLILFCLTWCSAYARERANGDPGYDVAMRFAEAGDNSQDVRLAWLEPEAESELSLPERPLDWAFLLTDPTNRDLLEVPPASQAPSLLRELFGNPFRPVAANPAWLSPAVVALAEGVYAGRAFDRLPFLADALQDAGCEHSAILAHCRSAGPHVRGCWVVDHLLGKE